MEVLAERVDPVGDGGEPLIGHGLQFDSAKVVDLELVFAAPINKGRLGDVKFGSDFSEGPPLGAEFDKPLDSLLLVHLWFFRERVFPAIRNRLNSARRTGQTMLKCYILCQQSLAGGSRIFRVNGIRNSAS